MPGGGDGSGCELQLFLGPQAAAVGRKSPEANTSGTEKTSVRTKAEEQAGRCCMMKLGKGGQGKRRLDYKKGLDFT